MNNSNGSQRKRPIGIFIFGGIFIIISVVQMVAHTFGYVWLEKFLIICRLSSLIFVIVFLGAVHIGYQCRDRLITGK